MSATIKDAQIELYSCATTATPYGNVCESTTLAGKEGPLLIQHVNPFALFYHAMGTCSGFANLIIDCRRRAPNYVLRLALYMDKATPARQADSHGDGRTSMCIYFTLLEFPYWFRSRKCGWIPFAYVSYAAQKEANATDSMLVRWILLLFDDRKKPVNFSAGFAVHTSAGIVQVQARMCLTIGDWEENIRVYNHLGYNAKLPCGICRNIFGRCNDFADPYLLHIFSTEHARFDFHSKASVIETVDTLQHVYNTGSVGEFELQQKSSGFKYDPDGLMWDGEAREKLDLPFAEYNDWMHGYVASGGVGQYEINSLVLEIESHGHSIASIDTWIEAVELPKGMCKLGRNFLTHRVVHRQGAHIKAFAGELLTLTVLFGFYLDVVIAPLEIEALALFLDCFLTFRIILKILQGADIKRLSLLYDTTVAHATLFKICYPNCLKPKFHQVFHVHDMWKYWGELLSCFAPERHHKLMKAIMDFAYKRPQLTALAYDVRQWVRNLQDDNVYLPIHLVDHIHEVGLQISLAGDGAVVEAWARGIQTETGYMKVSDVLQWELEGVCLGQAYGFVKVRMQADGRIEHVALLNPYKQVSGFQWELRGAALAVLCTCIIGAVPYRLAGVYIVPLLHAED